MNRLVITIIISLFLVVFFGITDLKPKYEDWSDLNKKIMDASSELQYQGKYFSDLEETSQKLEEHDLSVSKVYSALPPDPSLPSLFNFFQQASSQSGMILKAVSPSSSVFSELVPDIRETHFTLSLTGSYAGFKTFLLLLEDSARFIETEGISLFVPKKETDLLTVNLKLKVYSY